MATATPEPHAVHALDAQQAKYWNGPATAPWVRLQDRLDRLFAPLSAAALSQAAPQPGERVIDVGCGCGATTLALAHAVGRAGAVHGIDISAPMLARAAERARAEQLGSARFSEADAARHPFPPGQCDLIFSRLGAMFFGDAVAAFANLKAALAPGGRLVLAVPRAATENLYIAVAVQAARPLLPQDAIAAPGPGEPGMFSLADPQRVTATMTKAGFRDCALLKLDLPMHLGADAMDAAAFSVAFGPLAGALQTQSAATRAAVVEAVAHRYAELQTPDGVLLAGAFWIIIVHP